MRPITTESTNFTYKGDGDKVGDLPGEKNDGVFWATYEPTAEERERIAAGDNIQVGVWCEPIPPVSVGITPERELVPAAAGPATPADRNRAPGG